MLCVLCRLVFFASFPLPSVATCLVQAHNPVQVRPADSQVGDERLGKCPAVLCPAVLCCLRCWYSNGRLCVMGPHFKKDERASRTMYGIEILNGSTECASVGTDDISSDVSCAVLVFLNALESCRIFLPSPSCDGCRSTFYSNTGRAHSWAQTCPCYSQ